MNRQILRTFNALMPIITKLVAGIVLLAGVLLSLNTTLQAQTPAAPKTHTLYLSHHDFEDWTFKPQPKDQIDIINHADIAHSIYITAPDGTVTNLGVQLPGSTVNWQVPDSGDYTLQCWIHPVIHATLSVDATTSLSKR